MSINKIIIVVAIIFAIFIAFIFIQFNPLSKKAKNSANIPPSTVTINNQTFHVSLAQSEAARQQGLSGKDSLPTNEGLLFLFDKPDYYAFWMKDMKFPIDIIFINGNKIVSITENAKPVTTGQLPTFQPTGPSDKALEINAGLSKKYTIKPGDTVDIKLSK
jgi:uncharacterized membrane protein (UPF0127 family)